MDIKTDLQHELVPAKQFAENLLATASRPISDAAGYTLGAEVLQDIKARFKALDAREKEITRPLLDSLTSVRDLFRIPKNLLERAEGALKRSMLTYQQAEAAKAREAQRVAEELAEKERTRLAKLAGAAQQRGDSEKVVQFQERAAAVVAPIVQTAQPKVSGISTRKDFTFEIIDEKLLPRDFLKPDELRIRAVVRALGADANIPGVRIIVREILAARA